MYVDPLTKRALFLQSAESGGAIALYGSMLSVSASWFTKCRSLGGSGGAIWADAFRSLPLPPSFSSLTITDSTFSDCWSSLNGGALLMSQGALSLEYSSFNGNQALGIVGGGGMCINDVDAAITFNVEEVVGDQFQNNSAPMGGGGVVIWTGSKTPAISVLCAPGFEGVWTDCQACAAGTYKNSSGTDSCVACAAGSFATSRASSSCAKCQVNPSSHHTRRSVVYGGSSFQRGSPVLPPLPSSVTFECLCVVAQVGTYSNVSGAAAMSACLACPRDSSTLLEGASSLDQCVCAKGTCLCTVAGLFVLQEAGNCISHD